MQSLLRACEKIVMGPSKGAPAGGRGLPPLPEKAGGTRPPGKRFRATLTKEQAALIYTLRPPDKDDPNPNKIAGNSQLLSKKFGVSPKAVRDVWNRRTWAHATKDVPTGTATDDIDLLESSVESEKTLSFGVRSQDPERGFLSGRGGLNQRSPGRPVGSKDSKPRRRRSSVKPVSKLVPGTLQDRYLHLLHTFLIGDQERLDLVHDVSRTVLTLFPPSIAGLDSGARTTARMLTSGGPAEILLQPRKTMIVAMQWIISFPLQWVRQAWEVQLAQQHGIVTPKKTPRMTGAFRSFCRQAFYGISRLSRFHYQSAHVIPRTGWGQ